MKFELITISTKRFLLITLLSIPVIIFFSMGLAILASLQELIILIIPLLGLSIFFGQKFSKTLTKINLSESEQLTINDQKILYKNIIGYYINDTGLIQSALCLRLNTEKTIQIIGSTVGKHGKKFREAQKEIIEKLKSNNQQILDLEYQDVYVRQTNILKPIIYVLVGIVLIINIVALYFLINREIDLPWQIFFVNLLLIGLIPYVKKRNKTNANTGI